MADLGTSFADAIYEQVNPLTDEDASLGYPLRTFVRGGGSMFQLIDWLAQDSVDGVGWSRAVNVDKVPVDGLPWLAQFVGVTVQQALSEADQRLQVKGVGGWKRGTPAAMQAAVLPYLTGNKTVIFRERDGTAYDLSVIVYTAELLDAVAAEEALVAQKPAGIKLAFLQISGRSYLEVKVQNATYQIVKNTYATYQALRGDVVTGLSPTETLAPSETLTPA